MFYFQGMSASGELPLLIPDLLGFAFCDLGLCSDFRNITINHPKDSITPKQSLNYMNVAM